MLRALQSPYHPLAFQGEEEEEEAEGRHLYNTGSMQIKPLFSVQRDEIM